MTKTKHTPGPLEVRFQKTYLAGSHCIRQEPGGYEIARVVLSGHNIYRDWREAGPQDWSRLINAAPNLLEAAKKAEAVFSRVLGDGHYQATFLALRAAIAKAEGK